MRHHLKIVGIVWIAIVALSIISLAQKNGSCLASGKIYCGLQSPDKCWCDEYCTLYHDCCSDYQKACLTVATTTTTTSTSISNATNSSLNQTNSSQQNILTLFLPTDTLFTGTNYVVLVYTSDSRNGVQAYVSTTLGNLSSSSCITVAAYNGGCWLTISSLVQGTAKITATASDYQSATTMVNFVYNATNTTTNASSNATNASSSCTPPTSPVKIYSGSLFNWMVDPDAYCDYLNHTSDVSAFFSLPDMVMNWYVKNLGGSVPRGQFVLTKAVVGGWAGSAGGNGFGVSINSIWDTVNNVKGYETYMFVAHEGANYYTAHSVSPSWPCDWWADGGVSPACKIVNPDYKSPVPRSLAITALFALDWQSSVTVASYETILSLSDPWYVLIKNGYLGQYGISSMKNAFILMRNDGVYWPIIAPNPSSSLTNNVVSYLGLGALNNVAKLFANAGIPNVNNSVVQSLFCSKGISLGYVVRYCGSISDPSASWLQNDSSWCGYPDLSKGCGFGTACITSTSGCP